jgi:hypothetical protein
VADRACLVTRTQRLDYQRAPSGSRVEAVLVQRSLDVDLVAIERLLERERVTAGRVKGVSEIRGRLGRDGGIENIEVARRVVTACRKT